jgi:hypothetical protein
MFHPLVHHVLSFQKVSLKQPLAVRRFAFNSFKADLVYAVLQEQVDLIA